MIMTECATEPSELLIGRRLRDNFSYFSLKPYVVTPHLNCLTETVQMRGHNICFYAELTKFSPNYH